jgi:hypothetical protein
MTISVLEQFLREYVDVAGGLWDEPESQVYDVLWPDAEAPQRLTVDPEALAEHPEAQLLAYGLPLLDDLLAQAQARSPAALAYLDDLYLNPHALAQQIQRDLTWPEGLAAQLSPARPRYVTHTLFWFEATYQSDDTTQAIYSAAVDRSYGRLVRHLEPLLDSPRLEEQRRWPYPDAAAIPLEQAYLLARERVLRSVSTAANNLQRDWEDRQSRQIARVDRYFADMRAELQERIQKAAARGEATEDLRQRGTAIEREAALRIAELRRAPGVRVRVGLTNLLHLKIPRLFLEARLIATGKRRTVALPPLTVTWDPLVEKTDALSCPACRRPTYHLILTRRGDLGCPACNAGTTG